MEPTTTLGRSSLRVPRLGVGAMTWGDPTGARPPLAGQAGLRRRARVRRREARVRGERGGGRDLVRHGGDV